jgi:hypothetical protein
MAFFESLKSLATGNFSDSFDYLFMDADAVAATKEVQSAQDQLVRDRAVQGTLSQEQADGFLNEIQRNAYPYLFDELGGPGGEFVSAMKEGVQNLPSNFAGYIHKTVDSATKFALKAIPWYVWALVIVAAIIYFWPFLRVVISARPGQK